MSKKSKKNLLKELAQELDVFDEMLSTLLEILEQKGVLSQREFEERMKAKLESRKDKKSYRDIQLG